MVNGGQRNLGMAVGAGLLWLADSMLQVPFDQNNSCAALMVAALSRKKTVKMV